MAKKDKKENKVPKGMKCYKKEGGGSLRFANRIIKPGQRFWIYPDAIPEAFRHLCKEAPADSGALVINVDNRPVVIADESEPVLEKFSIETAKGEDGEPIKKGNSLLYNVIGEDGKIVNETALRKGKASELLETLNA